MNVSVDVLAVIDDGAERLRSKGCAESAKDLDVSRLATGDLIETLRGCRDTLREAAKQFRTVGAAGHATLCDLHADAASLTIARVGAGRQCACPLCQDGSGT